MGKLRLFAAIGLISTLGGCGGKKTSTPYTAPTNLTATVIPEIGGRSVVELAWQGGEQNTSYTLEAGLQTGNYSLPKVDFPGPATSYRWTSVPLGNLYVRLKGHASSGDAASEEILVASVDPRDVIDALFLGSGRLAVGESQGCPNPPNMAGWRVGSQIAIRPSTTIGPIRMTETQAVVPQVAVATGGNVTAFLSPTGDPNPSPSAGEITLGDLPLADMRAFCRCTGCVGCASSTVSAGFTTRVRIVVDAASTQSGVAGHEIGHGIGLCHIIVAAGFTPPPTMGYVGSGFELFAPRGQSPQFEPATLKAMQTVYGAGVVPPATRSLFVSKGLVPEQPSTGVLGRDSAPTGPSLARWPAGWRVEITGPDEYVVTKPVCGERER